MQDNGPVNRDQAIGLREKSNIKPIKVIAVTAGKGGVGKTNVSVNLAAALSKKGNNVMLFDADLGLANVDVMLGLHPKKNLSHVLDGQCEINEILLNGPAGIKIIPASSGTQLMSQLSQSEHAGIIQAFSDLNEDVDILIIDTAAGISETVVNFLRAAQEILVVVCDEPTSITDAYALIKVMSRQYNINKFHIVCNMVQSQTQAKELYAKLDRVAGQFLNTVLDYIGYIPYDDLLRKSIRHQKLVYMAYPNSRSSREFDRISEKINGWSIKEEVAGHLMFFIERFVNPSIVTA